MKIKFSTPLLFILCAVVSLLACKKESKNLSIKYEITTSSPIATSHSALGSLNSFATFTVDQLGAEETQRPISGTTWVKEIVIPRPTQNTGFGMGGAFYLSSATGTVTAKIFVDGKLEVEQKQEASSLPVANLSLASIGTYYQFVY